MPDFMAFNKMLEEGRLEEIKVILGWDLDTRRLPVRLLYDKYIEWSRDIPNIL